MGIKVNADGTAADVIASLNRLNSEQLSVARDVCKEFAREVVNEARAKAPVKTGKLRRAIYYRIMSKKGQFEVGFGWRKKAWYGHLVEYGHAGSGFAKNAGSVPAKPHLRPAFDNRASGLEERIGKAVERLMK